LLVFRISKPTTSVRREYQGISLASSPTNHNPPRPATIRTVPLRASHWTGACWDVVDICPATVYSKVE